MKTCYLCASNDLKKRACSFRDSESLDVLECQSCALTFLSDFSHITSDFYSHSCMHGDFPSSLSMGEWVRETEQDDHRRYKFLKPILQNKTLLDYGCGTGNFLNLCKKTCKEVFGFELEKRTHTFIG